MTTQKTVTAEDVERKAESFAKYHDEHARYGGASYEFHARAATFLRDTAAQVPALQEQVLTLGQTITGYEVAVDLMKEEHEAKVSAFQARVAELERELRIRTDDHAVEQDMRIKAQSERDALRAQVETMRGHTCSFGCTDTEHLVVQRQDVERGEVAREQMRELADFLDCGEEKVVRRVKEKYAALSTPPAEATDARRQRWVMKRRQEALAAIAKHPPVVADDGHGTVSLVWHDAKQKPRSYAVTTEQMRWMLGEPLTSAPATACEGCGGLLPYDGHVATPLCDACLDKPAETTLAEAKTAGHCSSCGTSHAPGANTLCPQ